MSIQYKFRSSVNFNEVEIGNRASISVGELRSRIIRDVFKQQRGFDLVFYDAVSGLEFEDDASQIPSGSSVIVKRVPGGTVLPAELPKQTVNHVAMKESHNLNPANFNLNGPMDSFDVVGADFCPMPDSNATVTQKLNQTNFKENKKNEVAGLRLPKQTISHVAVKESHNLNPNVPMNEYDVLGANLCTMPDSNAPVTEELNQTNFKGKKKDEVAGLRLECKTLKPSAPNKAIPRGPNQHENDGNILPNVDEHLKINKLRKSDIWAVQIELECSLCNNFFKNAVMLRCCQHSFCEKCIHQELMAKGMCPKCFAKNCSIDDTIPNLSLRQAVARFLRDAGIEDMEKDVSDRESGIQDAPLSPQVEVHADSSFMRRGGFQVGSSSRGGGQNFMSLGGQKKGVRNCYMCGSPDHLMRNCHVSHSNPMLQPGNGVFNGGMPVYAAPYWNCPSALPFTSHMYSNSTMRPFNASLVPVPPLAVPPYINTMHGSLPAPGVNMAMSERKHSGLQQCGHKRMRSS